MVITGDIVPMIMTYNQVQTVTTKLTIKECDPSVGRIVHSVAKYTVGYAIHTLHYIYAPNI